MNEAVAPRLTPCSVLMLHREGGFAHFPGFSRPRQIRCDQLDADQLSRLQALLDELTPAASGRTMSSGGDRCVWHLTIDNGQVPFWHVALEEAQLPEWLLRIWRQAAASRTP